MILTLLKPNFEAVVYDFTSVASLGPFKLFALNIELIESIDNVHTVCTNARICA